MKKVYLLLSLFIFIVGCEKDEVQLLEGPRDTPGEQGLESPSHLKYVKAGKIPEVLQVLESHIGKADKLSGSIIYKRAGIDLNAIVDLNSILEVVSSGKKTNYTFPLDLEGQPENEFYNVIVHKTASSKIKKPYVKRYRVDPDALESYKAHNRDFRYFKGTFSNHWVDDFFNAFDNEGGKFKFKAVSSCEDGGSIGGGGTYNPNLIDVNNDVTWNGLGQTGYGRALGTWNNYGGTGGYDLEVGVRNNSTGYREVASVNSITSGSVVVSTGFSSITVSVYESVTWINISTETTGSSGGSTGGECSGTTITRGTDGGYTVDVGDCLSAQKSNQPNTKAASDCPGDDGEIGVIDDTTKISIVKRLGLVKGSSENTWLFGELHTEEIRQVNNLYIYLLEDTTPEATTFGLEALRAVMAVGEVDFEEQVILDPSFIENDCLYGVYTAMGKTTKFKEYLQNFDENFTNPVANLILTTGVHPVYPNATAVTDNPQNYLIQIMFNPNELGRPSLDVARTFIHEMIHAEIYRLLLSKAQAQEIPWSKQFIESMENDYPGLYDYYMRYYYDMPNGIPLGDPQHEMMAQHYRDIIENALREYDNSFSDDVYKALTWRGLIGDSPIDPNTGLPPNPTRAWEEKSVTYRLNVINALRTFDAINSNCQ